MTNKVMANRYFEYLIAQIHIDRAHQSKSFTGLFGCLHNKEFVWIIPNDDNRIVDAFDLRREFWGEGHRPPRTGVSILEVLVALSRRLEFNAGGNQEVWAWVLIKNLKLHKFCDPLTDRQIKQIDEKLDALVWRTYSPDGQGGFFPLKQPEEDQTKVEIWYQMSTYINEHVVT